MGTKDILFAALEATGAQFNGEDAVMNRGMPSSFVGNDIIELSSAQLYRTGAGVRKSPVEKISIDQEYTDTIPRDIEKLDNMYKAEGELLGIVSLAPDDAKVSMLIERLANKTLLTRNEFFQGDVFSCSVPAMVKEYFWKLINMRYCPASWTDLPNRKQIDPLIPHSVVIEADPDNGFMFEDDGTMYYHAYRSLGNMTVTEMLAKAEMAPVTAHYKYGKARLAAALVCDTSVSFASEDFAKSFCGHSPDEYAKAAAPASSSGEEETSHCGEVKKGVTLYILLAILSWQWHRGALA